MNNLTEYLIIGVYALFVLAMGGYLSRFNRNADDFIRGGAQGAWWLVGCSSLMASISAFTFTGNASAIFESGFTPLVIYFANIAAFFTSALIFAPWFRQTRALTVADILRERYGPEVEQFFAFASLIMGMIAAAIWLWGLGTFSAAVFGLSLPLVILGIGLLVLLYSVSGGRWAVLATDFVQSLVLIPLTILVAVLCFVEVGGFSGMRDAMLQPEIAADFQFVKEPGAFPDNKFTWPWIVAIFVNQFIIMLNIGSATRYFSVKDGREARKAAFLSGILMAIGTLFWFIPPAVARFLYAAEVGSVPLGNPAEASYAVAAREVLPNGLMGLMVVAMFAATMSSMDTGLNTAAGIIVRNIIPAIRRLLHLPDLSAHSQLRLGRYATLCLGTAIISMALYFSQQNDVGLFDSFLIFGSVIGLPMTIPLVFALLVRSMPRWSYFFIVACACLPSAWSIIDARINGVSWTVQDRMLWVLAAGCIGALITVPFYRLGIWTSEGYKSRVDAFYKRMRTPVDFAKEIGEDRDSSQLLVLGTFAAAAGGFILLLLLLPNPVGGRAGIAFVGLTVLTIGMLLRRAGTRHAQNKRETVKVSANEKSPQKS